MGGNTVNRIQPASALIVTVGSQLCGIPIRHVLETMRPLPIEPIAGTPEFIRGISVIRGAPVPVVDLRALLDNGGGPGRPGRFVTVKVDGRRVALAVDGVVGVRGLDLSRFEQLPPLLRDADADLIEAVGIADAQLLLVLRAARIVPEEVWMTLPAGPEA